MTLFKGLESKLKWDIFWVGLIQVANYIFPFITTTYLIRTIGVESFGRTEFATLFILYFITLTNYEFHISGTRTISIVRDDPRQISASLSVMITAKTWLFLASTLIFGAFLLIWPERFCNTLFLFTYLIVLGHLLYQPQLFMGTGKVRILAVLNLLIKALSTLLIFLFIRGERDYVWVNLNYSLSFILIGLVSLFWAHRLFPLQLRWQPFRKARKALRSGFYIFLTNGLIAQVNLNLSAILLGFFLPSAVLGSYAAALKIITAIHVLSLLPLKQVFFPLLSYAWNQDRPAYFQKVRSYFTLSLSGNLVTGLGILACAPWMVRLIYGAYYPDMIEVMRMFSFLPLLMGLTNVFSDALLAAGQDKKIFRLQLLFALVNILVLPLAIRYGGLAGALISRLSVDALTLISTLILYRRLVKSEKNPSRATVLDRGRDVAV